MPALSKEQLLQVFREPVRKKINLPSTYGKDAYVWMHAIGATDLMELKHRFGAQADMSRNEFQAHILRLSLINEDGSLMFQRQKDSGLPEKEAAAAADAEVILFMGNRWGLFALLAKEAVELSGIETVMTPEGDEKN